MTPVAFQDTSEISMFSSDRIPRFSNVKASLDYLLKNVGSSFLPKIEYLGKFSDNSFSIRGEIFLRNFVNFLILSSD